ncbi:MAG TPA: hypothetical protein VNT33_05165, partial [Telluria sp.]|nr:hypothetical protein [Telluria sp.]
YANFIRNRFALREVVEVPVPLTEDHPATLRLAPKVTDPPGAVQDRRSCCGTMNLAEYYDIEHVLDAESQALARWCAEHGRNGPAGEQPEPGQSSAEPPGPFEDSGLRTRRRYDEL